VSEGFDMQRLVLAATMTALVASASSALACSCGGLTDAESYQQSQVAFTGELISSSYSPSFLGFILTPDNYAETATFVVTKAWKGVNVGQLVIFKSQYQGRHGMCGDNFRARMDLLRSDAFKFNTPSRVPFSKSWIVLGAGAEPYALDLCSRSTPITMPWAKELEETLDSLSTKPSQ
jgi:hypothetical protein